MEEITHIAHTAPRDPVTRIMTWTSTGWAARDLDADEVSLRRQRHRAPKPVTCLVADRRCKRAADPPAPPTASKRRRTMGPPPLPTVPERPAPTRATKRTLTRQQQQSSVPSRTKRAALATVSTVIGNAASATAAATTTSTSTTRPPSKKTPLAVPTATTSTESDQARAPAPRLLAQVPPRRWKRVRPLGCGTFGCVHEVRHPDTGERVALKEMGLLPNDYRGSRDGPLASAFRPGVSPQSAHMVFRELAAAAALSGHPSVVAVRDARLAMIRTGACTGGIECALLMDLMDGHLGRVIRTMAGRGDGSLASSTSFSASLTASDVSSSGLSLGSGSSPMAMTSPIDLTGTSPQGTPHRSACPFELRVRVARLVARDILPALAFMHDRLGLAHRDIKPNNILYTGDVTSDTLRFRLSDFGLARFVRRPGHETCKSGTRRRQRQATAPGDTGTPSPSAPTNVTPETKTKSAKPTASRTSGVAPFTARFTANVVTHLYKPPEVLLHYGTRRAVEHGLAYGCAVDMWSFGVVLMEVLAGGHLTPSEPEETLVHRVRTVFRLDGPPRPHLVRDLVHAMAARAATGRSGVGSIPRTPSADTASDDNGAYADLIDLLDRLLCVDPRQRISATAALVHPFVAADTNDSPTQGNHVHDSGSNMYDDDDKERLSMHEASQDDQDANDDDDDHDTDNDTDGADHDGGPLTPDAMDQLGHDGRHKSPNMPRFLPVCAYRALASGVARADERPRAGDPSVKTPTLAARRVAVTRACTFADRHDLNVYTVASAVAMLDHYLEGGLAPATTDWSCSDEAILVMMAGALFVACSLYECQWPTHDQFAALGVVPSSWYAVDRRAPSGAVRTPPLDAALRAGVSLFDALGHLTPHPDAIAALVDGSVALAAARGDTSPWRAISTTFSRYPPVLTLPRR
ncbi:Protein kinase domain containing protein [Pandoravirus celtis]|uniref:Protein kinase domain containing protein n=1 Tax=Pandoravirus celtis TaxID=2568002 RepID=A0A4D6EGV9_9VIRU|nr:Protein kinase domain containing protein [Pandoravirus celtis]